MVLYKVKDFWAKLDISEQVFKQAGYGLFRKFDPTTDFHLRESE